MLKNFQLKNGLQVATFDLPSLRSVHLRIIAKGGSLVEKASKNGVAHFMEHMLVQGTPSLPNAEEFSSFVESLAGNYGAYTERLLIAFNITVPATHLEDAVRISSEVFFEPLFVEAALEKERRAVIEELKQNMDSHYFEISKFFRHNRFLPRHPLTLDPGGTVETVSKLKRQDLVDFWQKYFIPQNAYLLVSGRFEENKLRALLEQYFLKGNGKIPFPGYPHLSDKDFSQRGVYIRTDPKLGANYIDLTFPSLSLSDNLPTRLKQNLALVILGGLRNSRLFKLLRYQKGLVYGVHAGASLLPNLGYVYITSEVTPVRLEEVVTLTLSELKAYVADGPTEEELKFVKNYLSNQWLMAFDHPSAIAGWIENDLMWNDAIRLPEDYIKMVSDMTTSDIKEVMQTQWDFAKLSLTVQGPIEDTPEVKNHYERILEVLP
ncbi:MAG: pitrilysin family protein [bacterium]|nr:pitrilysin family protein [bacterium]